MTMTHDMATKLVELSTAVRLLQRLELYRDEDDTDDITESEEAVLRVLGEMGNDTQLTDYLNQAITLNEMARVWTIEEGKLSSQRDKYGTSPEWVEQQTDRVAALQKRLLERVRLMHSVFDGAPRPVD